MGIALDRSPRTPRIDEVQRAVPILLYHSVSDAGLPGQRRWTVSPSLFDEHLTVIVNSRRTPLTVSELAAALRGERPLPARPVAITFDDGFRDTIDVVDRLAQCEIRSTVYVTTGFLGRAGMMTDGDVAALARSGAPVEIGAHGVTHQRLDELRGQDLAGEVVRCREILEGITGRSCLGFSYPHGNHDRRSIAAVRAAGYTSAVAVRNVMSHDHDDLFALARVTMLANTSGEAVAALLDESFPLATPHERLRTRGYRQARVWRRRLLPKEDCHE